MLNNPALSKHDALQARAIYIYIEMKAGEYVTFILYLSNYEDIIWLDKTACMHYKEKKFIPENLD